MSEMPYRESLTQPEGAELQRVRMLLADELGQHEELLWVGRPAQGIYLQASDAFMIPFSVLWAGFAFFWEFMVIYSRAPFFFALWGVPFVCVGIYVTVGRFFHQAWLRKRTVYGLTNRRVLILTQRRSRSLVSLDLEMTNVSTDESSDGRGTIVFGGGVFATESGRGQRRAPRFERISSVREVARIIRDAKERLRRPLTETSNG